MSKTTITRLFVGASVAVVVGLIAALAIVLAALAGGVVTVGGPQVVTVNGGAFAGTLVWLVVASLVIAGGALAAIASWIGALLNTARLDDKTWFVVLLILGLCSFGWIAMVAYLVAGPDGARSGEAAPGIAAAGQI